MEADEYYSTNLPIKCSNCKYNMSCLIFDILFFFPEVFINKKFFQKDYYFKTKILIQKPNPFLTTQI